MSHSTNDNIPSMLSPLRVLLLPLVAACLMLASACGGGGLLGKDYEYEEQLRLDVDGSARIDLNSSVAALVALRGFDLNTDPSMEVDRAKVQSMFEGPGVEVTSVRVSRRDGRRFVHVRVNVADIRQLSRVAPFSWSAYTFERRGDVLEYRQVVGPAAAKAVGEAGWDGTERVAFRMHIPSVIVFHNAPSRKVQRGNILEWEQLLTDRVKGVPVDVEVDMEPESILYTTLLLFGSTIVLAAVGIRCRDLACGQARTRGGRGGPACQDPPVDQLTPGLACVGAVGNVVSRWNRRIRARRSPPMASTRVSSGLELFERGFHFGFRLQVVLHFERRGTSWRSTARASCPPGCSQPLRG